MRTIATPLISFVLWLGILQVPPFPPQHVGGLISSAAALTGLTVAVYRLGVWRQEMENTKGNLAAELEAHHRQSTANFERLERRLESIEKFLLARAGRRVSVRQP